MGLISSKLDSNNKIIQIYQELPSSGPGSSEKKIPQEILDKYKDNISKNGGLIVNLDIEKLKSILTNYYDRAKQIYTEEDFKKIENPKNIGFLGLTIMLYSQFGLYIIVDQPKSETSQQMKLQILCSKLKSV